MSDKLSLAVVTGGHCYDVINFHRLFNNFTDDMDIYIQHLDDFATSPLEVRQSYDVVLFFIFLDGPVEEGLPWYSGSPKTVLEELGQTSQGIVILHHAILAYPQWPLWTAITGLTDRSFDYHSAQTVTSQVVDATHPITQGISEWTMIDETYTMVDADADSHTLVTYDHPNSMRTIAWTRQYQQSRVFVYEAGHDQTTWQEENFRALLHRGICWAGNRL